MGSLSWSMATPHVQDDLDLQLRLAAVDHCRRLQETWGDAVPASELTAGFPFGRTLIHLVAWGRGIFKPQQLSDGPLTLVSSLASRYTDERLDGNTLLYAFASAPSDSWANDGLERLQHSGRPLIFLKQVKPKPNPEYLLFAPIFVTGVNRSLRKFRIGLTPKEIEPTSEPTITGIVEKAYRRSEVQIRLHQAHFRLNVLRAYRDRCCVCDLRERRLLDAAHITSDGDIHGDPVVPNGLSMCPSHHRAFDRHLFEVDSDYRVNVDPERLESPATEATKNLLWRFHGRQIILPREKHLHPDPDRLTARQRVA